MTETVLTLSILREDPDRLFDTCEAASFVGKSKVWLEKHRWAGTGPHYLKIGNKPYYTGRDLLEYIEGTSTRLRENSHG